MESRPPETPPRRAPVRFFQSTEGGVFILGCCMFAFWVIAVAALWSGGQRTWLAVATMAITHAAAGRAASVAQGLQTGLPPGWVAFLASYMDATFVFVLFPVLVHCYRHYFEKRFYRDHVHHLFENAQQTMDRLGRFKVAGVFLFVWFPLWMTGIIAGSVLGFLLGLRTWVNMVTVVMGNTTAVLCWVYAYEKLFGWLGRIHRGVPVAVSLAIIAVLIAARAVQLRRRRGGAAECGRGEARVQEKDMSCMSSETGARD